MNKITCCFIGLGLLGGSIAKSIKRAFGDESTIIAFDPNPGTLSFAKKEGVIDVISNSIELTDFSKCNYLFLCAPITSNIKNLLFVKDLLPPSCLITDVGSVKTDIHNNIKLLGLEKQFIGGHPMAGSEKTGYVNSTNRLLENAYYILTPTPLVSPEKINQYKELVLSLGAIPLILGYKEHDYVTAAVSHLPHIVAAALVNLVKDSDTKDGIMNLIAAGGFKDITRISSSSATMWQQISIENQDNISLLLNDYINALTLIQEHLLEKNQLKLYQLFDGARNYRDSFIDASSGPIKKLYIIYVDIPDEPGVIATIATILANHNISLKNIGIVHNREFEEGVLRIEFYKEESLTDSVILLKNQGYLVYKR
ncbi:MAG TPA: prephenate dehydrogenase [Lachnospiraceae bacterium]|nr:prephenate dehydrogenase [Lachnospiraceae bacterium]